MKNNDNSLVLVIVLMTIAAVFLYCVWSLARFIGADFQITLGSIGYSVVVLGLAGLVFWFLNYRVLLLISCTLAGLWPCWWRVIDSIANGGSNLNKFEFLYQDEIWWNTNAFKYGIEIGLVCLVVYLVFSQNNDPYGY